MPMAERTAAVVWKGDLAHGSGMVNVTSGALAEFPVTWASRTERSNGKTSPEELMAAAHASCFSMALSSDLAQAGHTPERLEVKALCTLDLSGGAATITTMHLEVVGSVPGMDAAAFDAAAQGAKEGCPVSRALKGNVAISVAARLA